MENNYKSAMDKICLRKEFPEEMKKCLEQKAKVSGDDSFILLRRVLD